MEVNLKNPKFSNRFQQLVIRRCGTPVYKDLRKIRSGKSNSLTAESISYPHIKVTSKNYLGKVWEEVA